MRLWMFVFIEGCGVWIQFSVQLQSCLPLCSLFTTTAICDVPFKSGITDEPTGLKLESILCLWYLDRKPTHCSSQSSEHEMWNEKWVEQVEKQTCNMNIKYQQQFRGEGKSKFEKSETQESVAAKMENSNQKKIHSPKMKMEIWMKSYPLFRSHMKTEK